MHLFILLKDLIPFFFFPLPLSFFSLLNVHNQLGIIIIVIVLYVLYHLILSLIFLDCSHLKLFIQFSRVIIIIAFR